MDIYEALNKLSPKKKAYARWRFDLEYNKEREKHTPERLCEILGVKTLSEYIKWENSLQFLELTHLYLQTKFANDIEDVYLAVVENAKSGDTQSVKIMLQLQKEIRQANELKNKKKSKDDDMFDDLEFD